MLTNRQLFLDHVAQTSNFPMALEIEKAEGVRMFEKSGKDYIDVISGIGVSNVGHRHPTVINAIKDQLDSYMHLMVYGEFVQTPQVKLATKLSSLLPESLNSSYFVNSGSEAIEGALKLAKRHTNRTELISFNNAYHGSSHGALSINGDEGVKTKFRPLLPDTKQININNIDELKHITTKTAAVVIETVQGEAGVVAATKEFLTALREKCNETGTLLIFDEIQCGFGRTGTFFAFERFDIVPDIMTIAKGMGGGMPIGAFISSQKVMSCLTENPILGHISTFGGHPVCCASALATIEVIENESLLKDVNRKAELIKANLVHPAIKEIRNVGLMMAVEFESFDTLKAIIDKAVDNGVLTDWFLFNDKSMRIAPPLTITDSEIKEACEKINKAIQEVVD